MIALVAFLVNYWWDPLRLGSHQQPAAAPAFLFSALVLVLGQAITNALELKNANAYSDRIYNAIKDYLHVTPIGPPEEAINYIHSRLSALREVQNTCFTTRDEAERATEKLYETDIYDKMRQDLAYHCGNGLIWKDIGDSISVVRLRQTRSLYSSISKGKKNCYRFKLISHLDPQISFIILEYRDGAREVLFNWDFRGNGQDPTVLISRDRQIVEMFAIHFTLLWRRASEDHDSQATRSTSMK
ncbi:MAG TPA: hypothetical protein VGD01_15190 [Candidatus Elarobacter sp.]